MGQKFTEILGKDSAKEKDGTTELQDTREELRKLSKKLLLATQSVGIGIWEYIIAEDRVLVDDNIVAIYGIEHDYSSKPDALLKYVHPQDAERIQSWLTNPDISNAEVNSEFRIVRPDGEIRFIKGTWIIETDISGKPVRIIGTNQDITDNRKAERLLKESEVKYRSFFENSMDATLLTIQDGKVLAANPAACAMFGMAEEEICKAGRTGLVDLTDPNLPNLIKERKLKGKTKGELTFVRKDGTKFPGEISSSVFEQVDGEKRTIMIIRDLSNRVKTEAELKVSNERYRILSKATNDAVWDWNLLTNELWWGENFFTLFGYDKEKISKKADSWYVGLHPDDKENVIKGITAAIENKQQSWADEYRFYKADGDFLYIYDQGYLMYNDEGIPYRMIGSMTDITARKMAEEKLRRSEEGYRQIVETAQEGIWLINDENVTIFINKKMCEILGYSSDELMGRKSHEFMDEEWRKVDDVQTYRRRTGKKENYEFKFIAKDGRSVWTSISTNSVFNQDGSYRGAMAMVTDITQKKEQEIQIERSNSERELLISQLTKSNYDLQQFSYITSHNLRAPLSNLLALLSLIEDSTSLSDYDKSILGMFRTSTNQLNETINDLVQILIVKNTTNLELAENNIEQIYNEVYSTIAFKAEESNCTIELDFSAPQIYFHTTYLKSILLNLLTNAIRYRSSKRALTIKISTRELSGGAVVLILKDNGLGIDLKRHGNNLFGLYQKFHNNPESVGLGLYIVKSQITALGGSIDVESQVDEGTSFIITFKPKK